MGETTGGHGVAYGGATVLTTRDLLAASGPGIDAFSSHHYGATSQRCAASGPELWATWKMASLSGLAAEQAETNLKEASDRHQSGLVPFSDVLEAQLLQQRARDKEIDVRSEYWLKRSAFLRAVGRGKH